MRPDTIRQYLVKAEEEGFIPTIEGLNYYKRNNSFQELIEENTETIIDEENIDKDAESLNFYNQKISILIKQIQEVEKQGYTKEQAIEIVKLSYNI